MTVEAKLDIGPPHYEKFLPQVIKDSYGKWKYHEILRPGVLVPFIKLEPPYQELKDLVEKIWDFWGDNGKARERVGEFIQRVGLGNFLEEIEVEPSPYMVAQPRDNPYIFYEEYYEED